ncbi:S-adenosyl-L-methionine-dependent methyltransferase [Melanogaster broomeanus]|nr:S-adenosyl-L-methionine-dependent methyltransferase [Melanogaster broomeanus]
MFRLVHPRQTRLCLTHIHTVAQVGFGTGTNELYDRARPSYPKDSVSFIKKAAKTTAPLNIVEVGAGTGLFTRAFLAHDDGDETKIASLKAIEPSAGMRAVFKQKMTNDVVTISDGTFDNIPSVEDGWADLIIIAQAFHWCPDYGKACTEFARILKPDGAITFIWNLEDRDAAGWVAQLRDRIERHEMDTPQFRLGLWRQTFATESYIKNFKEPEEKEWAYHLDASEQIIYGTRNETSKPSWLKGDGRIWINESEGVFEYPYKTLVVVSRKK